MRGFAGTGWGLLLSLALSLLVAGGCKSDPDSAETDGGTIHEDAQVPEPTCKDDGDCDDGAFCNGQETCDDGQCIEGTTVTCDDGIDCTLDQCSERTRECESLAPDGDGDGHYDRTCEDADGKAFGDDCDDGDPLAFPGNIEYCDPDDRDEDCDPKTFGDKDSDDDGYLDGACCNKTGDAKRVCGDDCDDLKASVSPKATEACDLFDNDCDKKTDEGVTIEQYVDKDRDLHGKKGAVEMKCAGAVGFSPLADDCDDGDPERFKGQFEICDGKDNDCDDKSDEAREDAPWFLDQDKDGFGDASGTPIYSCERIPGRELSHNDCRDDRPAINPAAAEACDGQDNDCSGEKDFVLGLNNFEDDDDDGVADAKCVGGEDCDDRNAASAKGMEEVCDNVDNDCDRAIDEKTAQTVWFLDQDGDGWGVKRGTALTRCEPIPGRAANLGDCDDTRNSAHPGAKELCSGEDEDCDGDVDENTDVQCTLDDAIGICKAGACAVLSCFPGHDDCNGEAQDGCECSAPIEPVDDTACTSDLGCQDGDFCNGHERCDLADHLCYPGTPVNCGASDTVLQGDATIRNSLDIAALGGIETITGRLVVNAAGLKNLTGLESLRTIGGDLIVDGDTDENGDLEGNNLLAALVGSGLSNLVSVGGSIVIEDSPALTSLHLPALVSAGGLIVRDNDSLTQIHDFAHLVKLQGDLTITGNPLLTEISFDVLAAVAGDLEIADNEELDDPRAPKLSKLGDGEDATALDIRGNASLTTLAKLGAASLECVTELCSAAIEGNEALCKASTLTGRLSEFVTLSILDNRFDDCNDTAAAYLARVRTFDGFSYSSQPVGEVVLARSTTDSLEIQLRTASYNERSDTSFAVAAAAMVGDVTVGVYPNDNSVHIDGVPTTLQSSGWLDLSGGGRIAIEDGAYHVMWPDGSLLHLQPRGQFVEVRAQLSPTRRGEVEGLWGTFDGTPAGQLVTSTGIPLDPPLPFYTFYDLFIESWRVTLQSSLFEYPQGLDTSSFTDRSLPRDIRTLADLDSIVLADTQVVCTNAGVTNTHWFDACVLDVGATQDSSLASSFASFAAPSSSPAEVAPLTASTVNLPAFTTDPTDQISLGVVQTIPTSSSTDVDVHTSLTVYFDDEIQPQSVNDTTFVVMVNQEQVFGAISGALSESGNTILFFQPFRTLPVNTTVSVSMPFSGILDDGGNGLGTTYSFSFTTTAEVIGSPADLSFEEGTQGWSLVGDAAFVQSPFGSVTATNQTHMALISTESLVGGAATGQTSSTLSSGLIPVPQNATSLRFDWDFCSEEFDDFVGQDYDDSFSLTVTGPGGTLSRTIASVNLIGVAGSTIVTVPGMSGEHSGWTPANIDISTLGSPITLSFTVSDVGDASFTTAVFIDNLRFQ